MTILASAKKRIDNLTVMRADIEHAGMESADLVYLSSADIVRPLNLKAGAHAISAEYRSNTGMKVVDISYEVPSYAQGWTLYLFRKPRRRAACRLASP